MVLQVAGLSHRPEVKDATATLREGIIWLDGPELGVHRLIRMLASIERSETGTVLWNGRPVAGGSFRRMLGFLPNLRHQWFPNGPRVQQSLDYFAALWAVPRPRWARDQALRQWDLEPLANEPVVNLSSGQQKRFALAVSFLMDPVVWIAEFPFTGLDGPSRVVLQDLLQHRRAVGTLNLLAETSDIMGALAWTQKLELRGGVLVDRSIISAK